MSDEKKEIRKLEKMQTKCSSISNAVLGGGMGALMEVNKKIEKIKARRGAG